MRLFIVFLCCVLTCIPMGGARAAVGPHSDHSLSAGRCLTPACHTALGGKRYVHGPIGTGNCDPCHTVVFWNEGKHPELNTRRTAETCFYCHDESRRLLTEKHIHTPVAKGECVACHDPHGSNSQFLLKVGDGEMIRSSDLCFECHDKSNPRWHTGFHGSTGPLDCNVCHDAHSSPDRFQLTHYIRTIYVRDYLSLALEDFNKKNYKSALTNLYYVLQVEPREPTALVLAIKSHLAQGDNTAAAGLVDQLLAINPRNAEALFYAGTLEAARGDDFRAMSTFNLSLTLDPQYADAFVALARLQTKHHLDQEALGSLLKAGAIRPDDPSVQMALSQVYDKLGKKAEADRARDLYKSLSEKK